MHEPAELQIAQDRETPVQVDHSGAFSWRYAYARSADSREAGDRGQDYLALRCEAGTLAFALCDGVGQSFFGDLAARFLGEALVNWLWSDLPRGAQARDLRRTLDAFLYALIPEATALVGSQAIPERAPSLLKEVLEQKRVLGSEATFACGRIDLPGPEFERGRVVLAWMGDSRLRAWAGAEEITADLGDSFQTAQRWSSRAGPVGGQPSVSVTPVIRESLPALSRLLAYSDGLVELDRLGHPPSGFALADMLARSGEAAASDDCSYLEVALCSIDWIDGPLLGRPIVGPVGRSERGVELAWEPVPEATHYEVELRDGAVRLLRTEGTSWTVPAGQGRLQIRVRACLAAEPGEWSDPVAVDSGALAEAAPAALARDTRQAEPRGWKQRAAVAVLGIVLTLAAAGASPALRREARLARDWLTTATPTLAATATPSPMAVAVSTSTAVPSPWSAPVVTATEVGVLAPTAAVQLYPSTGSASPTATVGQRPASPRPSGTPARTPSAVPTPSRSPVATRTPDSSPTGTKAPTSTPTSRPTSSVTPVATATATATASPTATRTAIPTRTPTPTRTPRPRNTPTPSPSATAAPTPIPTP